MNKSNVSVKQLNVLRKRSILTRNMILTSFYIFITGVIMIGYSYYLQGNVLTKQLQSDSGKTMEALVKNVPSVDAEAALNSKDPNSPIQKKLSQVFNDLSNTHPNIAQGYIFGPELVDGNKTSIVALPTAILEIFAKDNMKLGDLYQQPKVHADAVREMLKSKKLVYTNAYTDNYGTWITVLYPFQNDKGKIIAYMGIDVDASLIAAGKKELITYSVIALMLTLLVVLILQYFTIKKTFAPIKALKGALEKLSEGDFTVQLKAGDDEFGQVNAKFNTTVNHIKELVTTMKSVSEQSAEQSKYLFSAVELNNKNSSAITKNIEEMSDQISIQSTSITESVVSLEEISSGVTTIASNTTDLSHISLQMKEQSEKGNQNIEQVITQMHSIHTSVKNAVDIIQNLQTRSNEIGQIVEVITEIASQTNLLSLNASIEAARAGEHGRGFAVVADEVKKLSEESRSSADQIIELISYIQNETTSAVKAIRDGEKNVAVGIEIVRTTGTLFNGMSNATDTVTSQIQEVSAATEEMVAETEQITSSIKNLAVLAENNSSASGEIRKSAQDQQASFVTIYESAEQMKQISKQLEGLVEKLHV
ncbi:methyl-accepting chemotaxis protein [Paenibacillus shirakamiensis]|uniref:Methyl-accepting chemotaxis protein n=1 Tax=Paenibacillus shirakamiensis TaxID=1265935 RepID=A0ABS4JEV9_9BACL|nr:methyl-accepting chemotaxis protein [Paenibacillus shirakamiensis]MBP2000233.1 methyl-accepting chemotaxis protein [Paenibacillus shirakamiensis]